MTLVIEKVNPARIRTVIQHGVWLLAFVPVAAMGQSAFWSSRPLALKAVLAVVALLAAFRPGPALLVVTALVPFSHVVVTRVWSAHPFAFAEALVLAFLAGYLWRQRRTGITVSFDTGLDAASWVFALILLGSCAVQFVVLQLWHDFPASYVASFSKFLTTEYLASSLDPRPRVDGRTFVGAAALMLEGIALLHCTRALCERHPSLPRNLMNMAVAAGVGVGLLSLVELSSLARETHQSILSAAITDRLSTPAIPSLNTAGVYLMFVAFLAIGGAVASRSTVLGPLSIAILVAALWLTRTRVAVVAGLATAIAGATWLSAARSRWLTPLRTVLISVGLGLIAGLALVTFNPFGVLLAGGFVSLHLRVLLAQTALRMIAANPLTGVGIGQYERYYQSFAPMELLQVYERNNPHNIFLWLAAELGVVGAVAFAWLIGAAIVRSWTSLGADKFDVRQFCLVSALVAFIITWSIGQPLAIPQAAFTFWIMFGAAVGYRPVVPPQTASARQRLAIRLAIAACIITTAIAVPVRARRAFAAIDYPRVLYGFYNGGKTDEGMSYRWAGPRIRFFLKSSVKSVDVPVNAGHPETPRGVNLDIIVNGEMREQVALDGAWRTIRIEAPATVQDVWYVDLYVRPIGVPLNLPDEVRRIAIGEIRDVDTHDIIPPPII